MKVYEAYKLFTEVFKDRKVISCYEYDSRFVFTAVHESYKGKIPEMAFDALFAVTKDPVEVRRFTPMDIPVAEYKRGKEIPLSEIVNPVDSGSEWVKAHLSL